MTIEFIPTRTDQNQYPLLQTVIARLQSDSDALGINDGVVYYGWPKFQDYEAVGHPVDLALLSKKTGLLLVRYLRAVTGAELREADESISQAAATAAAQMLKSAALRGRGRRLRFDVTPILYSPGLGPAPAETDAELRTSETGLFTFIRDFTDQEITDLELDEARSILEGAKALGRSARRRVEDPKRMLAAWALSQLEDEIAKFDAQQRSVALTSLPCPQRIRGLAGSGKTVILAMKAALAHIEDPSQRILVTYYTRSLRDHLTRLITRFHRHFAEGEPDWKNVHVQHGWGQRDLPGVYREACIRAQLLPKTYGAVQQERNPFDFICKELVATKRVAAYYDMILIDEGQDFPEGFYRLVFHLVKGERDRKQIVWAYDELQDIFDVRVRTPEELFGLDHDGEPCISLARSVPATAETNDFVLPKCYRNQRDVLVLAHAVGFGLYGQPVQMLQNEEHWVDVGYEVLRGNFVPGTQTIIRRPNRNSPTNLNTPGDIPLVGVGSFKNLDQEVDNCVKEVRQFLESGLEPHDIMVISIDDRVARKYLSEVSVKLAVQGVDTNNIIADRFTEPPFVIDGKVTLSTVYRAKGNEAAVVLILGCDAVPLPSRTGRNRLFTAFTRTKGWLRISGIERGFRSLRAEIQTALQNAPELRFVMPDPAAIETIQRDLTARDAKLLRAREEVARMKEDLGLTDDDLRQVLIGRERRGRR